MKKFLIISFIIFCILFPIKTGAESLTDEFKVTKIVTVGYDVRDQEKIFGDMEKSEIDAYLEKEGDILMKENFPGFLDMKTYINYLKNKGLIVNVNYK
ncbi:MAG: hypothetical protein Q4P29_05255 [Tissierellia bacterium]|nr:hypothetical protein [Tissierellia bacterium]